MVAPLPYTLKDQQLWLSPERSIYWENTQSLIISDLHLGKGGHFRRSGIAIPGSVNQQDLHRLFQLIQHFQPKRVLIVGDMFHSSSNAEVDHFARWRMDHALIDFHLILGNHDILPREQYERMALTTTVGCWEEGPFGFIHDQPDIELSTAETSSYYFSGHIHPGILLKGAGKQSLRFPCFYFGNRGAILPAFGGFTGLALIQPEAGESVFAIVNKQLMQIA